MKYVIQKMREAHIDDVCMLEKMCFPKPWTRQMLIGELENEAAHYIVYILDGVVVGYAGYWYTPDCADITNVAVHPDYRRMGIASKLIESMVCEAKILGANRMMLEVRVSNSVARMLYEKHGFSQIAIRKRYYSDNGEDAIIMIKEC